MLLFLFVTLFSSALSGGFIQNGAHYNYSLQRTYNYEQQLVSYRLSQIYFVSMSTMRDFRYDERLKQQLDNKVEEDTLRTLERQCNAAKQKRQTYLSHSKRNEGQEKINEYLLKAEQVDMSFCTTLKNDKDTIEAFKQKNKKGTNR